MNNDRPSIAMTCREEPLSDVQFQHYQKKYENLREFYENVNRYANCVNSCVSVEQVNVRNNGTLTAESLNVLQHSGAISVYNHHLNNNCDYSNLEGEIAVIKSTNNVANRSNDTEQTSESHYPAVHLTNVYIGKDKAKIQGPVVSINTILPYNISFKNAVNVNNSVEEDLRNNNNRRGKFEILELDGVVMVRKINEDQIVALYDFFYGRIEDEKPLTDVKAEYRFSCASCQSIFNSNLAVMQHILSHIDEETMKKFKSADMTNCTSCGFDFLNAFELRDHMENEHMSIMDSDGQQQVLVDANNNVVCTCRICGDHCVGIFALAYHLQQKHNQLEMPYRCGVCNFRSSLYQDVLCHFKKEHCDTNNLLCPYCFHAFQCKDISSAIDPSVAIVWKTDLYFNHVQTHKLQPSLCAQCDLCTLSYVESGYLDLHLHLDHMSQIVEPQQNITNDSIIALNNEIFDGEYAPLSDKKEFPVYNVPHEHENMTITNSYESNIQDPDNIKCYLCGMQFNDDHVNEVVYQLVNNGTSQYYCRNCAESIVGRKALITDSVELPGEIGTTVVSNQEEINHTHSAMDISDTFKDQSDDKTRHHSNEDKSMVLEETLTSNQDTISAEELASSLVASDIDLSMIDERIYQSLDSNTEQSSSNPTILRVPDRVDLQPHQCIVVFMYGNNQQSHMIVNNADIGNVEMQEYFKSRNATDIFILFPNEDPKNI